MDLIQHVAKAVAPVLLLALIGYAWKRGGWAYDTAFVSRLVDDGVDPLPDLHGARPLRRRSPAAA